MDRARCNLLLVGCCVATAAVVVVVAWAGSRTRPQPALPAEFAKLLPELVDDRPG